MLTMWQFCFVSGSCIYLHSFEWGGTFFQDVLFFTTGYFACVRN